MIEQARFDGDGFAQVRWRARSMQLINWGGFDVATIEFSEGVTLLTGPSGAGKSTILDAYLALMMDSRTPFNGASNDGGKGRARGATQRNLLTYLRGKLNDTLTDGESSAAVLRGSDRATWGAIAMTFADASAAVFTALRLYYVPRGADRDSTVIKRMYTTSGSVDLKEFAPLADDKFDKRAVRSRFPSIDPHESYEAFAVALQVRLGIGTAGEPSRALRLLARIQSGAPVAAVDDLYKQMVLEQPATYQSADLAIRHFADLEAAYEEMTAASEKASTLEPIAGLWDDHTTSQEEMGRIDAFGLDRPESPFAHWAAGFETGLVVSAIEENRTDTGDQIGIEKSATDDAKEYGELVELLEASIEEAGGGELTALDERIARLEDTRSDSIAARALFDSKTVMLGLTLDAEGDFAAAVRAARVFIDVDYDSRKNALDVEVNGIRKRVWDLEREEADLVEERDSLRGRTGQVPRDWHEARVQAAQANGLAPEDLPFVAELIDVTSDQAQWRTAIEVTLFPVARLMLVDQQLLGKLSRSIDQFSWKTRISFQGVDPQTFMERPLDPAMLSGKLIFNAESLFSSWVQERVTARDVDALCVSTPDQLDGHERRVTRSGQMRHGRRGAHGGSQRHIIGFDSKARLDTIARRLDELVDELAEFANEQQLFEDTGKKLLALRDAHSTVLGAKWAAIDHQSLTDQIQRALARKTEILESDDDLQGLEQDKKEAAELQEQANRARYGARNKIDELDTAHVLLDGRREQLTTQISRLEGAAQASAPEQVEALGAKFSAVASTTDYSLESFTEALRRMAVALRRDRDLAAKNIEKAAEALERIFESYLERWPDPNLGTSVESFSDFLETRSEIVATGLHERRDEWVRRLTEWTGEDLVPLNGEFDEAFDNITDRLAPVNKILESLPFGAYQDRLRIDLRKLGRDDQAAFRKELRELSSGATAELTITQAETKFARIRAFIAQIREPAEPGERTQRDYHLDVRKHIELSASVIQADGSIRAVFTSLGEKSGGETQELIAFIVGAALRFQLGDGTSRWPRFAPVLLDEGFVKADSEFAGRGVNAWKGLGFQLIVAAPPDKVTSLERHVDQILSVVKDEVGRAHVYEHVDPAVR